MQNTKPNKTKLVTTAEFDARFDAGEDIAEHLDFSAVRVFQPQTAAQKVNVDFPSWVVQALDQEAERIGIARQALIKIWIVERIEGSFIPPAAPGALRRRVVIREKTRSSPIDLPKEFAQKKGAKTKAAGPSSGKRSKGELVAATNQD